MAAATMLTPRSHRLAIPFAEPMAQDPGPFAGSASLAAHIPPPLPPRPVDREAQLRIALLEDHVAELHSELHEIEHVGVKEFTSGMERCEEMLRLHEAVEIDRSLQMESFLRSKATEHEMSKKEAERAICELEASERKCRDLEHERRDLRGQVSTLREEVRQATGKALAELRAEFQLKLEHECHHREDLERKHRDSAAEAHRAGSELAEQRAWEQGRSHEMAEFRLELRASREESGRLQGISREQSGLLQESDARLRQAEEQIKTLEADQRRELADVRRREEACTEGLREQREENRLLQETRREHERLVREMTVLLQGKTDEIARLTDEISERDRVVREMAAMLQGKTDEIAKLVEQVEALRASDTAPADNAWAGRALVCLPRDNRGSVEVRERAPVALGGMLQSIFFFGQVPEDVVLQMLDSMEKVVVSKGDVVGKGNCMFLVEDGCLQETSPSGIRNVYRSNIFGERALLGDRGVSTVKVVSDSAVLWRVPHAEVDRLASRTRMGHHFKNFAVEDIDRIAASARMCFCYSGEQIPLQHRLHCYLIESGKFVGNHKGKAQTLFHGDIIGTDGGDAATVMAQSVRCGVWAIDRDALRRTAASAGAWPTTHGHSAPPGLAFSAMPSDAPWITALRPHREAHGKTGALGEVTSTPHKQTWCAGDAVEPEQPEDAIGRRRFQTDAAATDLACASLAVSPWSA